MSMKRVIGIGETVLDILFKNDQPQKAVPGGSTFNSIVSLGRDGARSIRVYMPEGCVTYPVQKIETVSTVGAGDNFNAGYIYAMMQGVDDWASRIEMAQRWSQDVCRQIGNNISDALVASIKKLD